MPQVVTATLTGIYEEFGNLSLDCPKAVDVESTEEASCILSVLKAAGTNVNCSINNNATLAGELLYTA